VNFEDARDAANKLTDAQVKLQEERKSAFEALMIEVEKINPALGGFEEMAMLLALPEEQFAMLAPVFLEELEKSFNNIDDKLFIAQAMNASGTKMEDLQKAYVELIESLDAHFSETISGQKIDFLKRFLSISYNSIADVQGVTKRIVQVPIELTSENAKIPTYAHLGDGAVDLYAPCDFTIGPGETKIIPVDIKVALPYGYAFLIHPRSGLSAKTKLRVANSVGLVDSQYKGVIGVILENVEPRIKDISYEFDDKGRPVITSIEHGQSYSISKGERFAQMRLVEVPTANFFQVESVDGIGDDRNGGFGSSGTH
jgi:dUTP pyrophosphatase